MYYIVRTPVLETIASLIILMIIYGNFKLHYGVYVPNSYSLFCVYLCLRSTTRFYNTTTKLSILI